MCKRNLTGRTIYGSNFSIDIVSNSRNELLGTVRILNEMVISIAPIIDGEVIADVKIGCIVESGGCVSYIRRACLMSRIEVTAAAEEYLAIRLEEIILDQSICQHSSEDGISIQSV